MNSKVLAERRQKLLDALDAEDARLAEALQDEATHPPIPPFRYDAVSRIPRGFPPPRSAP